MRRRPSDWRVIETARETAPGTRTLPSDDATSTENEGATTLAKSGAKSGKTQTRTQGATTVNSGSDNARAPMVFGRRATYFDNPRLALFAPPRWPGGGGGRSARRSAKS